MVKGPIKKTKKEEPLRKKSTVKRKKQEGGGWHIRWRGGSVILMGVVLCILASEKGFRRIGGYKEMVFLKDALLGWYSEKTRGLTSCMEVA